MRFFASRRKAKRKPQSTRLHLEALEARELLSTTPSVIGYRAAALALVPYSAVNDQAVRSGNWSSSLTWQNGVVPEAHANVLIPSGLTVNVDTTTDAVHTIRVDGTLQFATNLTTNLVVDTLVINTHGRLLIGGLTAPIAAGQRATITFSSNGPIDTAWDPNELSRGLLSLGTVTMYGATTTPYDTLTGSVAAGATALTLATLPTNWRAGDQIVVGGTFAKWNQDEVFTIRSIQGTHVALSAPLAHAHTASNGVPVYITDLTRNVVLRSEDQMHIANRGHVMFLSNLVNINYAEFLGLDRTNKSVVINDPRLNSSRQLIAGTGTNPRDRDAVDFYEIGTSTTSTAAVVFGSTVVHSAGWGFVNHSSYVNFSHDVAFDVNGASFVAEAGDEIGSFANDLAIHSVGTGDEVFYDPARVAVQDWAHEGDGFWSQGNGVSMLNNVAIGQASAGYYYYIKPYTLPLQDVIPSTAALNFHANLAESCDYGAFLRYETNGGTIDGLTAHDCVTGYIQEYCTGTTLQNSHLYGTPFSDYGILLPVESAQNFLALNDNVSGYPFGIRFSEEYRQSLIGGTWNNRYNIDIPTSIDTIGRTITITNPTFAASSDPRHYNIFWENTFGDVFTRNINAFFVPDAIYYNGNQLFAPWQAANYIPFRQQPTTPGAPVLPAGLIGLTNLQLLATRGLAIGGILPHTALRGAPLSNGGTLGTVVTYPSPVYLSSAWQTSQLAGYQLLYYVDFGPLQSVGTYNLAPGWNVFTLRGELFPRTLFVLGLGTKLVRPEPLFVKK
jgi:hypothetical protein